MRFSLALLALLGAAVISGAVRAPAPVRRPPATIVVVTPTPLSPVPFFIESPIAGSSPGYAQVYYVLASGGSTDEAGERQALLAAFVEQLQVTRLRGVLVPEPGWDISNLEQACSAQPNLVVGGLLVRLLTVSGWVTNRAFERAMSSAVDGDVLYLQCRFNDTVRQPKQTPSSSGPAYTWRELPAYAIGTSKNTDLSRLSILFPLAALYESFAPTRTTTVSYPSPPPPGGGVSQIQTTINSNQIGSLGAAVLGQAAIFASSQTYEQPKKPNIEVWNAINELVSHMVADTRCSSGLPSPVPSPTPHPWAEPAQAPFCL